MSESNRLGKKKSHLFILKNFIRRKGLGVQPNELTNTTPTTEKHPQGAEPVP